jgi:tight adherence protein B
MAGFWPPLIWIQWTRGRRIRAMERLMPGALDQMADCLHGGQTLEQAAESVSLQTPAPLKEEFGHCVQLLRMGQSPVAVMDRLSRRIPLPEFRLFATAVLVHRQTGGNLAQLTARLAVSARDRQEWRRHLGAQTVTGRYSAVGLVACAVVGLTVLSIGRPEYTGFFLTHPRGPGFLAVAVALMIVGIFWISRVVKINY